MKSCNPLKLKLLVLLLTAWTWIAAPVHGQNSPVPQIDLPLVPASAQPGGPAFTLTVNGAGFVSGSAVYWNGNSRTTTFVSSMQLTALINAADIATAGTASVTVMNPAPGGGYSDVAFFEVTNPASTVSLTGVTSSTGNSPTSVVVAQFNGDGFQDLAVTNEADNTVSILLGNGNGTFQPHVDYATGYGPEDVSVGDFNHDGVLDLAVVNGGENLSGQPANSVSILLGNGDGTFQAHVDYPTGQFPFRVAVGDFNGDGNLDLAIVAEYDNAVSILLGNGDGTFQPEIEYGVSAQPTSIVVSDFNGDGILDLAVANFVAHSVSILLGNGDGTFQPASDYNATENPASLAAADLNGDGIPDLAVADFGSAAVSILIGNGDGTFQNQVRYATGTYPEGVAVGDFNGDGILDLALPNDNDLGSISVLLGTTNETFQSALSFPGGLLPVSVAAADFNDDGMLDAVTTDVNNNAVSVMLSTTLAFTPTSINFGSVNIGVTSSPQTVTLTNIGTSALSLSSIATAAPYNQTNNTCSGSLGAGATCRVSVTFTPTGAGTAPGALTITDGAIGSPQIVMLSGSGSGPVASFSPSSFNFGNQIVGTTSTAQIVTLTNTGNATLNISSLTAAGAYAIASSNCGSALAASANCTITVTFTPTQTGTLNGGISLADNAYQSPQTVPLTGVGTQGTAILNPTSLTFNVQLLNTTSAAQTVTLTNEGTAVLTINSVSNPNSFLQTNNCGTTVAVGGSCTFTVTFHPAMIGNLGASFVISDNGANSPQSISLSGTATEVSLNPTSLNFGSVNLGTSSSAMTVTLTNVGSSSMSISPITFGGADPADFAQTNTCGSSVGAGASCTFSVTFTPGGVGTRTATLSITDTGGASPQTVTLSGTGNPTSSGPAAQFAPSSVNFGNQNYNTKSLAQIVTVTDTGAANLSIASAGTTISDYAVTNNCPSTITPGANCTFSITFTPAAVGTRNGALTVSDNAPGSPQSVPLTGIGVGAVAGLSPASLTYGLQLVGTNSASQALTLSNTGNATLTVSKLTISTNFTETDNCSAGVNAGSSCTINVTFAPTMSGTPTGTVTVFDNSAGSTSQQTSLSGSSTIVTVSPTSLNFGTVNLGTTSSAQTVTLTNVSTTQTLNSLSESLTGSNTTDFAYSGSCGNSVPPQGSCTLNVTFTPGGTGSRSAVLNFSDNGGGSPQTVALSGTGNSTGSGPVPTFNPTSLNFGNQNYGTTSKASTVTLTNTGTATLNISSASVTGPFAQTNNCPSTLAVGSNCAFSITFTPNAVGTDNGALMVTDNATGSPQSVTLTGTGVGAVAGLSPASLTYGLQLVGTNSASQALTLSNTGNATLTVSKLTISTNFTETDNCSAGVNAGSSCTINVTFAPTMSGTPTGTVTVFDNSAGSTSQQTSLSGSSTIVTVSPTSLNFGTVNLGTTSSAQTVTLTNVSTTQTLNSLSESLTGSNTTDFAYSGSCGNSVPPQGSCTLNVTFTPGGTGSRSAVLNFSDNGGGSPQTVALSGTGNSTGSGPVPTFNPTSLNFGNQNYGTTSKASTVTLTNTGTATLNISSASVTGPFAQTNNCPSTLAVGSNCAFSITFTPNAVGTDNGALIVTDNATGSPQSVTLTGTGVGAVAGLSPASLTYGLQLVGTNSASQALTLSNTGNATLTVSKLTISTNFTETDNCSAGVNAGSSCTINVTFAPTMSGTPTGTVTVFDNSAGSTSQQTSLSGSSTIVTVSPTSLNFGTVNLGTTSSAQTVTLTNVSTTQTLNSLSESLTGSNTTDFAYSGSCGNSVPPQGSCTLNVTFTPGGTGSRSAVLNFSDNGGGSPQTVALSGTGNPTGSGPVASFNPTSLNFGNQNYNLKSKAMTVTLTNTGTATLTISSATISGPFGLTNNCPGSLSAGSNCTFSVTFTPNAVGTNSGTLTVTDNAPGSPQTVPLTGVGIGPVATVAPLTLTYGLQLVGTTSASQAVTVTNTGNSSLTITSITAPSNFSETNNCPSSLAPAANCTVNVTFEPTASGNLSGSVQVDDNSSGSASQKVTVSGTATAMNVTPSSLSFGSVNLGTTSAPQVVSVTNVSTSSVAITSVTFTGSNTTDFVQTNNCGSSLGAGASCAINVTFTPGGTGSRSATLNLNDKGGASPQTVALSGTGNPTGSGPQITFNTTSVNFGNENYNSTTKPQTVVVYSTGSSSLGITSVTTTGNFAVSTNGCPSSLSPGANCTVSVTFTPKSVGTLSGTLNVADNAPQSPQTVALTGTGVGAAPVLNPTALTFALQVVGTFSPSQPVTLTNTGNASLTITSISAPANYSQTNNCGSSVAAGASCTINVTFVPTKSGTLTGSITVADNGAGSSSQKITLTGTATYVSLSPVSLSFGTVSVGQSGASQNVTLANLGTTSVSITSIGMTGNDPGDFSETNTCGKSVPANGSCTITVTFTPQATGARTASLSVADTGVGSPQTVSLSGTGD